MSVINRTVFLRWSSSSDVPLIQGRPQQHADGFSLQVLGLVAQGPIIYLFSAVVYGALCPRDAGRATLTMLTDVRTGSKRLVRHLYGAVALISAIVKLLFGLVVVGVGIIPI